MAKQKTYTATDIQWDTDGVSAKRLGLPKELKIVVPDDITEPDDINEFISDKISEETGYCHFGFATTPKIPGF